MIQSPFLRGVLAVALLSFAAFCVDLAWTEGGSGTVLLIALSLGALTFAVGLMVPGRRRIALRIVAGGVVALYVVYGSSELWRLLHGEVQPFRISQPSALSAGLGILLWGVPLLVYAFSGRTPRENAEREALAHDITYELRDRRTLDALVAVGADLTLVTEVRFYLDAPTLGHARSLENVLTRQGHAVEVYGSENEDDAAICVVTQALAPTWENIRSARQWLSGVAEQLGSSVDGWEAAVHSGSSDSVA